MERDMAMTSETQAKSIKVWDPLVRYGHWALVAAFAVAYLSGEEESGDASQLHIWSGYAIGAIVVVRVLWGLFGAGHARFTDFAYGPKAGLMYLGQLLRGQARRYIGHSPAGAVMVFAILLCLAGTVGTGLLANGGGERQAAGNAGGVVIARALAEENEHGGSKGGEGGESAIGELHGMLANITLGLIVLHILGVGLASVVHRENLVLAMITGRKRPANGS
jgi:cytochrome b